MKALVLGAGGFIGSHLVRRLKSEGYFVRGVDLKYPDFSPTVADEFLIADLREPQELGEWDEIYQLAADMGGAGYVFSGKNDFDIIQNSARINLNAATAKSKIFFSSSACVYSKETAEHLASPDSAYGWEKLFSEKLYLARGNIRIARLHNIFGPEGAYRGGREKAPAAICRKVAENDSEIEIWGDGEQTRSFLYIDECIEGIRRLMKSDFTGPVNIGSDETVTINQLARIIMKISGKELKIRHIPGPQGVRGRTSDNQLIQKKLNWSPQSRLEDGLRATYQWINLFVDL